MASLLDLIPLLFKTAPAVAVGMKGVNYGPQQQIAGQMSNLANAQVNMDNPLFKSLYGQNMQAGQQNLAQSIAELQRQNRMAISNGQNPLLSQETGSGDVFRNLMQGYQGVQNTARTNTFGQLQQGETALNAPYNAYSNIAQGQLNNNLMKYGASNTIGDALQGLFGLNKQSSNSGSTPINWNTLQSTNGNNSNSYNMAIPPRGVGGTGTGWNGVGF